MPVGEPAEAHRDRRARRGAGSSRAGPTKKSAAAISRAPVRPDRLDDAAGERERPPASRRPGRRGRSSRPSCRGCGWPGARRCAGPGRSSGRAAYAAACRSRPACRTSAPTRTQPSLDVDAGQPRDAVDVDEVAGAARRMLSIGIRLCPPARTLPSWPTCAEHRDGLLDGARRVVHERGRLHLLDPACRGCGEGRAPLGRGPGRGASADLPAVGPAESSGSSGSCEVGLGGVLRPRHRGPSW